MTALLALAYSYIRFSHPSQAEGNSLRRQVEAADDWCRRNGIRLDTSTTLHDLGKSAYTGAHRKNPDRNALAAFLKLVEAGKVPRGSYLIIENLDRLSREHIQPALLLALNLLQAGIRIVQLKPSEMIFDDKSDTLPVMMMMMELSRGHGESAMKSERIGDAWRKKKERAAANGEPMTEAVPAWLHLVKGKWEVDAAAAAIVQRVFLLAATGYGITAITKKLNAEGVPVITARLTARGVPSRHTAGHWARSYVSKLLTNRAVVGEFQPYKGRNATRTKDGEPITGYYPVIVSEEEWLAARASMADRRSKPGRPSKVRMNVFAGMVRDARDGSPLNQQNKGKKGGGSILVSYKAIQGTEGAKWVSFPFATFERAVLSCLREINPHDILNGDQEPDESLVLAGQFAAVENELVELATFMDANGFSPVLGKRAKTLEDRKKELGEKLADAQQRAANPLSASWGECRSLAEAIDKAPDAEEARVRLRAVLRRIVDGIWCLFLSRGMDRVAAVQIWFAGSKRCRDYLILHRPAVGGAVGPRAMQWWCRSLASVAKPGSLDLRKPEAARKLEAALVNANLENIGDPK